MSQATAMISSIKSKYAEVAPYLNERSRRIWAATEAKALGYGGKTIVNAATGLAYATIKLGLNELEADLAGRVDLQRVRRGGGGRKKATAKDPNLATDLQTIVEASTRGDPEVPLLWCSKSVRNIADALNEKEDRISHQTVSTLLHQMGYSLQSNRKVQEGANHPDRDAQFQFINESVRQFQAAGNPVISVDAKKKENIGEFKNAGQEYAPKGKPTAVKVHDFIEKEKGKAAPYGIYDITKDKGWVSVGISSDTAEFAVNSIRTWWQEVGKEAYPDAREIYVNADGGGSNGSRVRLWKTELQKLANTIRIPIVVSHLPPATSKWNKIEHKMFCFISKNWRGRPLVDTATIINLIGNTTTKSGLTIRAHLDEAIYETGIKISDKELAALNLEQNAFHGEWNYKISPQN
jgi:low affinity Fe/Cu permease